MDPSIWVVVTATILSSFFALTSFSLRSFGWAKIEDVLTGAKGRRRLDILDKHLRPLQLTMSLCKAMSYLVLIGAMSRLMGGYHNPWNEFLALCVAGGILSVFGVAIPHAWASYNAEKIIAACLPVLMLFRWLLYPITLVMAAFDVPIRRLSGASTDEEEKGEEVKQEILQAAAEGQAEGLVNADEMEMLESIMEFGHTDAAEIMTPRTDIFALPEDTDWTQAAHQIHRAGHTRVPIYQDNLDNITGLIYAKDLLKHVGSPQPVQLTKISRKPFFVPETIPLNDLLREFKSRKVHVAIVLDEYGGTAGLVSIEDVLEEIVGDIADEYDATAEEQIRRINETTIEADGRLRVDELNDLMDLDLPEDEDYDTIAGYAVSQLGFIPPTGETFLADDAEFTILEADERKVSKIRIHKLNADEEEE